MKDRHLRAIEKLRQSRERTAAVALAASRAAGRKADDAVASFESELESQSASQLQVETSLYGKAVGSLMTDQQMKEMSQRIQECRQRTGRMGKHLLQLREEAAKAAARVEAARRTHAASVRSSKKWEKLKQHIRKRAALEEMRRDEGSSPDAAIPASEADNS